MNRSPIEVDTSRNEGLGPVFLIYLHVAACFVSMAYVVQYYAPLMRLTPTNSDRLLLAALNIAPFALLSILFAVCRFSFGYLVGFYFFTMLMGYLWLLPLSTFSYDHVVAYASAFASGLTFLLPAMLMSIPARQRFVLSEAGFRRLLTCILVLAAAALGAGALYNVRLVGISEIYNFRNQLEFPAWLSYGLGITSNVLLPFAFACFVVEGAKWRAALCLLLLLMFYPITLAKLSLFAPVWLIILAVASRAFSTRTAVILSLLVPILFGILLARLLDLNVISFQQFIAYFSLVNFRMIALTSSALDFYNDFFAHHDLTWFCQVNALKSFIDCPYREPLAIVMQNAYNVGNFNASLFATEGIASVGVGLAPLAAFICGLVVAVGNSASSGLPSRFVLLSAGVLPQIFLNVSLTITFVTNGAALLFILWYVTPRPLFGKPA
ncbi:MULTISPECIES: hypothetical protein [unclassified Bradyrhizobium]|uniref:hypothetical protein n=1 Tax=unclassified Bradyrhizobium TaxID=2631580 RepID=UPI0024799B3C|nr:MULTISPECIES: hypothetical protein [unclassified Bradyrhizobium]WGR73883.1 hypothetical protein MTX24_14165 [Bradyrhizobium sp. ISRA426]WGR78720.1 hypothetical protein MTX21_39135 [Bradyrhizobium sp. ISRA430]WGR89122.1 hypothetical protein MTX25_14180 [Bradyrhizobium sp. ISRA432]